MTKIRPKRKKLNTRDLRSFKNKAKTLSMLTCYDYQTARALNGTDIDLLLVGDSLGNVVLGYDTTVEVSLVEMITFAGAVKRGAPDKFVVVDLPFGSYLDLESGLKNTCQLFKESKVEAVKLEGAFPYQLELIERLTQVGIPVMGHIGLTPQSVHQQGGYYIHGKDESNAKRLIEEAKKLEQAGVFSLVLECVTTEVSKKITEEINVPTIGIGSGSNVDGQVLVINDLFGMGEENTPSFVSPVANFFELKQKLITQYLQTL